MGVVQRQHRLKPAGNGVGDVRHQLPGLRGNHQPLALVGLEAIAIHFAGGDLAVDRAGHPDALLDLVRRPLAQRQLLLAEHLELAGEHRLTADLGQLPDVEHQRVGHAARRGQPHLAPAGLASAATVTSIMTMLAIDDALRT